MQIREFSDGYVIHGAFPDQEIVDFIKSIGKIPLSIHDPPYGNIVDEHWDKIIKTDIEFCDWMLNWTKAIEELTEPQGICYVWGGIGIPNFRPFFRYCAEVEIKTNFKLANLVTWKKLRSYGLKYNYLFTREELAYLVLGDPKKPRLFNIPLLDTKRGYAGYNEKYPAKSEYYRRTNVWTDITEIFRGKKHPTEKPTKLHEIIIGIHTNPGEYVLDCFGGGGITAIAARNLGRKFIIVEKEKEYFDLICSRLEEACNAH